jgi:hypothetical protein
VGGRFHLEIAGRNQRDGRAVPTSATSRTSCVGVELTWTLVSGRARRRGYQAFVASGLDLGLVGWHRRMTGLDEAHGRDDQGAET